jgi:hypothetical protein
MDGRHPGHPPPGPWSTICRPETQSKALTPHGRLGKCSFGTAVLLKPEAKAGPASILWLTAAHQLVSGRGG